MKKPILCVIFGGKSNEYEVSLRSCARVLSLIDEELYDVIKIGITKNAKWYIYNGENCKIPTNEWQESEKDLIPISLDLTKGEIILSGRKNGITPDIVFPVMHGDYGEDGAIQGFFEMCQIRYAGCDHFSSAYCMDKHITKLVASHLGIPVAKDKVVYKPRAAYPTVTADFTVSLPFEYPVFVKPARSGSSVGVSLAKNEKELILALEIAFKYSDKVLIEEKIEGAEVEVGVIERDKELIISPPGRVIHSASFYDYETKYSNDRNEYIIPYLIQASSAEKIKEYAKALFYSMGCKGLCRMDFFVNSDGQVLLNEINTMPGFTKISMMPMLFESIGIEGSELIDIILKNALRDN